MDFAVAIFLSFVIFALFRYWPATAREVSYPAGYREQIVARERSERERAYAKADDDAAKVARYGDVPDEKRADVVVAIARLNGRVEDEDATELRKAA